MNSDVPRRQGQGRRVLVIGAGVSGLTCALELKRRGFEVTVVAERFAPEVTSVVAGALWEWPPAACGQRQEQAALERARAWAEKSYGIFEELASDARTGVFVRPANFYFHRTIEESPQHREQMEGLRGKVKGFRHDPALIEESGINPAIGLKDAYSHLAPMIDTDTYLNWLRGEVERLGCHIIQKKIVGTLREQEGALAREYRADAIVNCAGLGAEELAGEAMFPLRGALIRVRNDGKAMPKITRAHCVAREGASEDRGFVFIVPRGDDMLLLGGLAEPDERDVDIGLHNYEPVRAMYRRCVDFLPALRHAEIDAAEPVRVGLRPFRRDSARLEAEEGTKIVHNYGHGGAGVTLSWGCAREVVQKVEALVSGG